MYRTIPTRCGIRALTTALALLATSAGAEGLGEEVNEDGLSINLTNPPGEYVFMGTHRQYVYCKGEGSPTVVFETGLGGASLEWYPVHDEVAAHTRACLYDRAGYGWSDNGPLPRDVEQIVQELDVVLQRSENAPPFVLVGHSFGGLVMQHYASQHPDAVAGLVLVESSHPQQFEFIKPLVKKGQKSRSNNPVNLPPAEKYGRLPTSLREQASFMSTRRKAIFTQMDEIRAFRSSAELVDLDAIPQSIPVVVLAREPQLDDSEVAAQREEIWRSLQEDLAAHFPKGSFQEVNGGTHNLHMDKPKVVSRAILDVVNSANTEVAQVSLGAAME